MRSLSSLSTHLRRGLAVALVAATTLLAAAPAVADGFIVVPRRPPDMPHVRNVPLAVKYHRVNVKVNGRVAVTEIDQVFINPNPRRLEGTYIFPLPRGATIDKFSMWLDGKELKAELLDAARARSIYEGIVRRQQDPALLEYGEQGMFKARIFPIEPHGEKRVRISYAEVLSADNGTVAYRYPLNTEKFSSRPLQDASVRVTIDAGGPVTAIYSPSHRVDVPEDKSGPVTVGWEARNVKPDKDFLLYWRPSKKDVGITAIAHRVPGEDKEGTFLLVISPAARAEDKPLPKDVVFVMDTSGSMAGPKMDQARAALRFCLRSLGPDDRFGLVPFSTEPRPFRDALVKAGKEEVASAVTFVDKLEARGGTAIDDALGLALDLLGKERADAQDRPALVLFVTDGLPTIGETQPETILKHVTAKAAGARIFAFGVGNDVNTHLIDRVADENRGTRDYVAESESIEEKVSNLYSKLARPAMTDLTLSVEGVETTAVHPKKLRDLFHGAEMLVVGRYAKPGNAVIKLRGKVGGKERLVVEELKLPGTEARHEFLPRLWGVRRVGYLLHEIRLRGETEEVRSEVVKLARRFGIVTPYTSYLILEDEARPRDRTGFRGDRRDDPARPGLGGGRWDEGETAGGGGGGSGDAPARSPAPAEAERELHDEVARAAKRARAGAEAKSGADAVDVAREELDLQEFAGDKDDAEDPSGKKSGYAGGKLVRHVSGRSFVRRGGIWWDLSVDLRKERRKIEAFSEEYFALVRAHPAIGPYLKLGNVTLVVGDQVIDVRMPRAK